jgi:hypothetical protein
MTSAGAGPDETMTSYRGVLPGPVQATSPDSKVESTESGQPICHTRHGACSGGTAFISM